MNVYRPVRFTAIPNGFNVLRFGASCLTRLDEGKILVAFWRYEDCVCP